MTGLITGIYRNCWSLRPEIKMIKQIDVLTKVWNLNEWARSDITKEIKFLPNKEK